MQPNEWHKIDQWEYQTFEIFNGYTYCLNIVVEENWKSLKYWVALSSGKKRKDLSVFIPKDSKSGGGIRALIWAKNKMMEFPEFYENKYYKPENSYICIYWADSRRRNIYQRLERGGFKFFTEHGVKILRKKL